MVVLAKELPPRLLNFSRKNIILLSLLTLFGFSAIGILLIHLFQDDGLAKTFALNGIVEQLWRGLVFGSIAALNALWLIHSKILKPTQDFFSELIKKSKIGIPEIVLLSLSAGVGEEIFFRGAIQPFLGVWPTAIVFIALHGYLNPKDWKMLLYGLLMVIVSGGLGLLTDFLGIYASITAHFMFDLILLAYLAGIIGSPIPSSGD